MGGKPAGHQGRLLACNSYIQARGFNASRKSGRYKVWAMSSGLLSAEAVIVLVSFIGKDNAEFCLQFLS